MNKSMLTALTCSLSLYSLGFPDPILAQSVASRQDPLDDIIVTARKRDETSIAVPLSITALGQKAIESQGIRTFDDVARLTPSLTVGQTASGIGGTIVLRGVGTSAGNNPTFDQTVSVNIDGVQISRGNALRLGQIDMQSIEILKGPQALFFGKNSPSGVISIKTADPTDTPETIARLGYEPNGRDKSVDLVLSGPINDWLKIRAAGSFEDIGGWQINDIDKALPANQIVPDAVRIPRERGPASRFYFGRLTFLISPSDDLSIRAKYSYGEDKGSHVGFGTLQRIYCPAGVANVANQVAALGGAPGLAAALQVDDCKADGHYVSGAVNPAFQIGATNDVSGTEGGRLSTMENGSLQVDYKISPVVTLTSLTGHIVLKDHNWGPFVIGPTDAVFTQNFNNVTNYKAFTQEVRAVTANPNSRFNAVIGAFYEHAKYDSYVRSYRATDRVFIHDVDGKTVSLYGQGIFNVTDALEFAAGARWSHETKDFVVDLNGVPQALGVNRLAFDNVSPEATLTYRPSKTLTVYGAYRSGFKSGGFAAPLTSLSPATAAVGLDTSFKPERVNGGEIGLKTALNGGRLRINIAAYYNSYKNLQVSSTDNSSGVPVIKVTNAASATNKGIDADLNWRPAAAQGLSLYGSVNYNIAKYTRFIAPCYIGQTIADGCTFDLDPRNGRFVSQDVSGQPLLNAPRWSATLGASYEVPVSASGIVAQIATDISYKSSYQPNPDYIPTILQSPAAFVNASLRLRNESRTWELALIGRNLTEIYRVTATSNVSFTGSGLLTGSTTPGGRADIAGYASRGRQFLFQLTLRPNWLR